MIWVPWRRKETAEAVDGVTIDLQRAEQQAAEAAAKLDEDRNRQAMLAEGVRAARRTAARVDRFTTEMERSFRRVEGHG